MNGFPVRRVATERVEVHPEFTWVGDDTVIRSTHWLAADGRRQERYPDPGCRAR